MPYRAVEDINGLRYIFNCDDEAIPRQMLITQQTYSAGDIDAFFSYVAKKCGYNR